MGIFENKHHDLINELEDALSQQDRDRYTRLLAKLRVISQDVDACVKGEDANNGNINLTLRAMRLNANESMYMEKVRMHQAHPWYFQLLSMLNMSETPVFSRAEERFIESLRVAAETCGKLDLDTISEVAAEAQGLDTSMDSLRWILDAVIVDSGLTPGSDEYGLWMDKLLTKKIVTMRKPNKRGMSSTVAATSMASGSKAPTPVAFPGSPVQLEAELEGDHGGSFYLTDASVQPPTTTPTKPMEHLFVNE